LDALEEWLYLAPFHMRSVELIRPFLDWQTFAGNLGGSTTAAVNSMNSVWLTQQSAGGFAAEENLESGSFYVFILSTNDSTNAQAQLQTYLDTISFRMFSPDIPTPAHININSPSVQPSIPWPLMGINWQMGMWVQQVWLCHNGAGVGEEAASNYLLSNTNIHAPVTDIQYTANAEEAVKIVYDASCIPKSNYSNPVGFGVGFSLGITACFAIIASLIVYDVKSKKAAASKLAEVQIDQNKKFVE